MAFQRGDVVLIPFPSAIIQPLAEKAVAAVVSLARTNAPGVDPDRLRKLLSI